MVRIAPVRLAFNPKTLWFDAGDLELAVDEDVVVQTARGLEFGTIAKPVFEMSYEDTKKLKSPLKPVKRLATDEDRAKSDELAELGREALPEFKRLAAETLPDMNPVAVEYLFDGDKAVFYFESEERVDFRDLVKKLGAQFHVRVDMKQSGVRDEARLIGGIGHCGQELCCRRIGGDFNPVSIRMAKEQDLSLNPQKISGLCGRLMCCLRYEYDAYKDFHTRAPKKNAKIATPDGEGRVVDLDVPREVISIKVGDEKPVKVPLADMDEPAEGTRPTSVGAEAWEKASEPPAVLGIDAASLFSTQLTGQDKLAEPGHVRHMPSSKDSKDASSEGSQTKGRSRRSRGKGSGGEEQTPARKARRRRSTTVSSDGTSQVSEQPKAEEASAAAAEKSSRRRKKQADAAAPQASEQSSTRRRRTRKRGGAKGGAGEQGTAQQQDQPKAARPSVRPGQKSSSLRAGRTAAEGAQQGNDSDEASAKRSSSRRRRRSHRAGNAGDQGASAQNTSPAGE